MRPCAKNIQVSMFCTYVVKYLDLIQSAWMTRASIYLIQSIVTKLNHKVIIFQVIRCIPLATKMKFLYILYICKWPPVNTVYYFVTSILYKEPAHTCCTDDRKGQVLFMWSKGFYSFNSLVMLIISGFLWFSTKQGLVLVTWCRAGQFSFSK